MISGEARFEWIAGNPEVLKITNPSAAPSVILLAEIVNPRVQSNFYGIEGKISYQEVKGVSFLELWNHFANPDAAYFSRTLAASGKLQKIQGSSKIRDFSLPFNRTGTSQSPTRLVIQLHLTGAGTVEIEKFAQLREYEDGNAWSAVAGEWWPAHASNLIGALGGGLIGCWGGLIGFLASRGKARAFVLGSLTVFTFLGVAALAVGSGAVIVGQPWHVSFGPLLLGIILTVVSIVNRKKIRDQIDRMEIDKMKRKDATSY